VFAPTDAEPGHAAIRSDGDQVQVGQVGRMAKRASTPPGPHAVALERGAMTFHVAFGFLLTRPRLWRHPTLLPQLLFGPMIAAQYWLVGPGRSKVAQEMTRKIRA
jgi:hypothetical protein